MMGTPAYGKLLATSVVGPDPMAIPGDRKAGVVATVCWTVLYFGLAASLVGATLETFDRCLGRTRLFAAAATPTPLRSSERPT
jgi:uncharacterized membrane protein